METPKRTIEPGTPQPNEKYKIDIMPRGPYLVYGNPPLQQKSSPRTRNRFLGHILTGKPTPLTMNRQPSVVADTPKTTLIATAPMPMPNGIPP